MNIIPTGSDSDTGSDSGIHGVVHSYPDFAPAFVAPAIAPRRIDVWLPPSYALNEQAHFPVIYMHDGQNLFFPELASTGIDWGVDEAIVRLMERRVTQGAIVVGLWSTDRRRREYMPQSPLEDPAGAQVAAAFAAENGGAPLSDAYLHFLVDEVKPFIDRTYRTQPTREHTYVMGSSMGGLASLYALCTHHDVFGAAGCLSTHWPIGASYLVQAMSDLLPRPGVHRIYYDYGTATLDASYEPFQLEMDHCMELAGYRRDIDWVTRKFPGAEHTEAAWRARVEIPLAFLLQG